jgi:predicted nucleic acid-binding protein
VLVDSSAWIEYFRTGRGVISDLVDGLLQGGEASICGMIELEILQGLRARERERVSELFSALAYVETERRDYIFAGERLGDLRRQGITIPSADALIGALCIRHSVPLLTSDKHFDYLPEVERVPLAVH